MWMRDLIKHEMCYSIIQNNSESSNKLRFVCGPAFDNNKTNPVLINFLPFLNEKIETIRTKFKTILGKNSTDMES